MKGSIRMAHVGALMMFATTACRGFRRSSQSATPKSTNRHITVLSQYCGIRDEVRRRNLIVGPSLQTVASRRRRATARLGPLHTPLQSTLYDLEEKESTASTSDEDTVFALSSGSGVTAVAVIRISGRNAFDALKQLLSPYSLEAGAEPPKLPTPRMASLRILYDPLSSSDHLNRMRDPLDSALVLIFPEPRSFTGEDIVELHCHGSRAVTSGVLKALSSLDSVRPADPGEFTQRAYGNGKLGLVEVEALADLIVADTSLQRKQALQQFDGRLSRLYLGWRKELIKGLAHAEAVIDFGDDEALGEEDSSFDSSENDGGMSVWADVRPRISSLREAMDRHLEDASRGELLRDGLRIAIVGRPNAGKSSLLNLLAGRDAAIVSSTPGTTRDVVEVVLDLDGVRCSLLDTAGVREEIEDGVDEIEIEGMKRARLAAQEAHLIVGVVDCSDQKRGLEAVQELIRADGHSDSARSSPHNNLLYVLNKRDLFEGEMEPCGVDSETFAISCTTNQGVDIFLAALSKRALAMISQEGDSSGDLSVVGTEGAVITRARHRRHVEAASDALQRFEVLSSQGYMVLDMAAEELRLASSELGRVTGAIDVEDVLDVLFADFCIGK